MFDARLELSTPALLFPAISLLMLAYTNRYVAISNLIRNLHRQHVEAPSDSLVRQIASLRRRVHLIRNMQTLGVLSMFLGVLAMALVFTGHREAATVSFLVSLGAMLSSLTLSLKEIQLSVRALSVVLEDIEGLERRPARGGR